MPLALPDESLDDGKKSKGGKSKGGGGKKAKEEKIPAKTQIKIDNVMRIMAGESAKDKGKKTQASPGLPCRSAQRPSTPPGRHRAGALLCSSPDALEWRGQRGRRGRGRDGILPMGGQERWCSVGR